MSSSGGGLGHDRDGPVKAESQPSKQVLEQTAKSAPTSDIESDDELPDDICLICHISIGTETPDSIVEAWAVLPCSHRFGSHCIKTWLGMAKKPTCPICSRSMQHSCGHPTLPRIEATKPPTSSGSDSKPAATSAKSNTRPGSKGKGEEKYEGTNEITGTDWDVIYGVPPGYISGIGTGSSVRSSSRHRRRIAELLSAGARSLSIPGKNLFATGSSHSSASNSRHSSKRHSVDSSFAAAYGSRHGRNTIIGTTDSNLRSSTATPNQLPLPAIHSDTNQVRSSHSGNSSPPVSAAPATTRADSVPESNTGGSGVSRDIVVNGSSTRLPLRTSYPGHSIRSAITRTFKRHRRDSGGNLEPFEAYPSMAPTSSQTIQQPFQTGAQVSFQPLRAAPPRPSNTGLNVEADAFLPAATMSALSFSTDVPSEVHRSAIPMAPAAPFMTGHPPSESFLGMPVTPTAIFASPSQPARLVSGAAMNTANTAANAAAISNAYNSFSNPALYANSMTPTISGFSYGYQNQANPYSGPINAGPFYGYSAGASGAYGGPVSLGYPNNPGGTGGSGGFGSSTRYANFPMHSSSQALSSLDYSTYPAPLHSLSPSQHTSTRAASGLRQPPGLSVYGGEAVGFQGTTTASRPSSNNNIINHSHVSNPGNPSNAESPSAAPRAGPSNASASNTKNAMTTVMTSRLKRIIAIENAEVADLALPCMFCLGTFRRSYVNSFGPTGPGYNNAYGMVTMEESHMIRNCWKMFSEPRRVAQTHDERNDDRGFWETWRHTAGLNTYKQWWAAQTPVTKML